MMRKFAFWILVDGAYENSLADVIFFFFFLVSVLEAIYKSLERDFKKILTFSSSR